VLRCIQNIHSPADAALVASQLFAGELQRAGGFAKDTTPFSEFLWADFLRRRMNRKAVETDFDHAIEKALQLAKKRRCRLLVGLVWSVPAECGDSGPVVKASEDPVADGSEKPDGHCRWLPRFDPDGVVHPQDGQAGGGAQGLR
jgi:hypothetical protein